MDVQLIYQYFPKLSEQQRQQFAALEALYREWNAQINVISRKDIDNLYPNHVLHSLAIAKVVQFKAGAKILDLGTGGGFPGIPLAILFPETHFDLVDGRGKKIVVCKAVIEALGLTNCEAHHGRAEEMKGVRYDFVVTRAVAKMAQLSQWSMKLISKQQQHGLPNGILALKGSHLKEELKELGGGYHEEYPIYKWFPLDFFQEKAVVYLQY